MIKTVRDYIRQYNMILPKDEIIAGVSGGADSVCMFLQLIEYRKECEFDLKVVHINHMIRNDAGNDADFVKDLCDRNGVEFYLFNEDVIKLSKEKGISTEEAGREVRYERFRQVMSSKRAKIAVAHNKNDVAETVLFNIFRGTGIEGLASLAPVNGNIIRPLLDLSRDEIEAYLIKKEQPFRTDSTNAECDYARNKIRNVMLPYAEKNLSAKSAQHIADLSKKMLLIREYIKKETTKAYLLAVTENEDSSSINLRIFSDLDSMLKREVILLVMERLTPHRKDITGQHVASLLDVIQKEGEKKIDLPYDLEAVKQYDTLTVRKSIANEKEAFEYDIENGSDIRLKDGRTLRVRIFDRDESALIERKTYTKWFDYDKIVNCVKVRNRRAGDYLTINSDMDKKSLKDYLIDSKVAREKRDSIPVIADDSHILWVVGLRISEYYKVSDTTKRILEISVK